MNDPASNRSSTWILTAVFGLTPLVIFAFWLIQFPFGLVDDAYIPMVYARNLAAGHGIVFYPGGDHVEGYSSPLWMALLSACAILRLSLPSVAWISGILCGVGCLFLTFFLYRRVFNCDSKSWYRLHLWPCAAAMAVVADVGFVAWSASGLETAAYTLLILLLVYSLIQTQNIRAHSLLLLLVSLTRPEGAAFLLPCLFLWLVRRQKLTTIFRNAGIYFLLPYFLFLLFRFFYFGYVFPNTFYAKHDFGGAALVLRGLAYVGTFLRPRFLFCFVILWPLLEKEQLRQGGIILLFAVTHLLLVVLEGGDHFALHRFLVPAIPLLSLLSVRGIERCCDHMIFDKFDCSQSMRVRTAQVGIAALMPLFFYAHGNQLFEYKANDRYGFSTGARRLISEVAFADNWSKMGKWLKEKYPPDTTIAVITAGAIPYYSELRCIDLLGMNDVEVAHTPARDPSRRYAGHEKSNPDSVLTREPRFVQLFPLLFISSKPYPEERLQELFAYPAQYDLWNHPLFRERYEYMTEETEYGFISYFERR
ncbi:MAG: hypothetical protein C4527_28850 [Candidatus Omnitrophota bacterium]|nr:MAG: hypothetical protein C4527_28850 [Candidatus Omnitrophota bacterium]